MSISEETFFVDPQAGTTLQTQLREFVAGSILSGRFRRGEKLPSSRRLAAHLGISRITVTLAYTELAADDYVTALGRSGYYVSDTAPEPPDRGAAAAPGSTVDWNRALGQRFGRSAAYDKPLDWQSYRYPFLYGQADPDLFDTGNWRLCAIRALGRRDFEAMTSDRYDTDDEALVDFIVRQILPRRGIAAAPDEVLVTLGAQNALWLTAQILLTQRRRAAIEDPCYPALRDILQHTRCRLHPVAVDDDGLPPEALPDGTDVVFTTPSHQCPTNRTMPLARRDALLARAEAEDMLIVEDDYEFEMSFLKPPSPALKSRDTGGRVVYVGSFSKSLFPGLRLGYLVGPAPFISEARALRATVLRHPPGHLQRTAAYFLSLGHYDAQIRRMAKALQERRAAMLTAAAVSGLTVAGPGSHGGSSLWMRAASGCDTGALAGQLRRDGVLIEPGAPFFAEPERGREYYRLAYSSIPAARIAEGIARIADAMAQPDWT